MDPQKQATNSQGYAPLSEESYSASSPEVPRNVVVQGLPVMPMSYPVPMGNFEIYNPVPSELQKLETCPYVCYKYWLAICIAFSVLSFFSNLNTLFLIPSEFLYTVCTCILRGWDVYQCTQVYGGIRDRVLEKVNKGIASMKIFMVAFNVFYLISAFYSYDLVIELLKQPEFRGLPRLTPAAYGVGVVFFLLINGCVWFLIMLYPAMKVRDILKSANGGQANVRHYSNV